MTAGLGIGEITAGQLESTLEPLSALLSACVEDGASVNFVLPFTCEEARDFWRVKVFPGVRSGHRMLLAAWQRHAEDRRLVGTVQLACDTPPNAPHRAEVSKLLVHPQARRQGIARRLMIEIERHAAQRGRSLLTLDTRSGDPASLLYRSLGFQVIGEIPGFCLDPLGSGRLDATTYMFKSLSGLTTPVS